MLVRLALAAAVALLAAFAPSEPRPPPPRAAAAPAEPKAPMTRGGVPEFTPIPETNALHEANPHDHEGRLLCQRCHRPGEPGVIADPIELCSRCHDPSRMKHPFGVAQPNPPADLPFAEGGRIVCHTCHDPHDVKSRKSALRLEYDALCARCHVGRHGDKRRQ